MTSSHDEARRVAQEAAAASFAARGFTSPALDAAINALAAAGLLVTPEIRELCSAALAWSAVGPPPFDVTRRIIAATDAYRAVDALPAGEGK